MRSHRAGKFILSLLAAVSFLYPAPLRAQYPFPAKERMACPTSLINMYVEGTSVRTGIPYTFRTSWMKASAEGLTQAYYNPPAAVRAFESIDQRARWLYPGIYVACWKLVTYRENGTIENAVPIFDILITEGEVREIDCASPATAGPPVYTPAPGSTHPDYYYDGPEDPSCDEDGGGDGGGGSGSGGGYEYICVDVWVPGQGWEELWCGYAPVAS